MARTRGARLAVREARLITKELRLLGVPPQTIAKTWAIVIAIPVVFIIGYLAVHYDSGTADPSVLARVQITYIDNYRSHVHNDTGISLKSLTVTCFPGGDAQPETSTTTLYPLYNPDMELMLTLKPVASSCASMRVISCGEIEQWLSWRKNHVWFFVVLLDQNRAYSDTIIPWREACPIASENS